MRICYFGTYRDNYSRNRIMIDGLKTTGAEVFECHETLWYGIDDRVNLTKGGWKKPSFWWRVLWTYLRLIWRYLKCPDYDIMVVGYPGQFDIFLARILCTLKKKPLVWDVFMSLYLISIERTLDQDSKFTVNMLHRIEDAGFKLPDMLIMDTSLYVDWLEKTYAINRDKFRLVPTGADDRIFHINSNHYQPSDEQPFTNEKQETFQLLYYGTYIKNHNVPFIVEAAKLLQDQKDIHFCFVGDGPERNNCENLVHNYGLRNITFIPWLEKQELINYISDADVCLGAFGSTPQSLMTVQNKIYECMALGRPVISGDSQAVRQAFIHGENIYLCDRTDPCSLSNAILTLYNSPKLCGTIAVNCSELFQEKYSVKALGKLYYEHLQELILK